LNLVTLRAEDKRKDHMGDEFRNCQTKQAGFNLCKLGKTLFGCD